MKTSVIIPTWNRPQVLRETLHRVLQCTPGPDEVLVHIDAGDEETQPMLASAFPEVQILRSDKTVGPGGGRNKLVEAASSKWIVSLDDDSWPAQKSFFADMEAIAAGTAAHMIACRIIEQKGTASPPVTGEAVPAAAFVGCGCVFQRDPFLATGGYVPLRFAYGMEEKDVALKLLEQGSQLVYAPALGVIHDCDRDQHHADPAINAAQISNTILLAYLRYPLQYWPYAVMQLLNRVLYACRMRRFKGIGSGLAKIPLLCYSYRAYRETVSARTIRQHRQLVTAGGPG